MRPFTMTNDARAKTASKDLQAILADCGFDVSLTQSQQIVAKMYGYQGWQDLRDGLGQEPSLDDGFLMPEDREDRRLHQIEVLTAEQMDPVTASAVIARLRLTNRVEAPDALRTRSLALQPKVGRLGDPMRYHPMRLWKLTQAAADRTKIKEHHEAAGALLAPHASKLVAPIEDVAHYSALHISNLTEILFRHDDIVIDASGLELCDEAPEVRWRKVRDYPSAYIHFGPGKFASPYPGSWIEGCYLSFQDFSLDDADVDEEGYPESHLWLMPVSTGDIPAGMTPETAFAIRPEVHLSQNLRAASLSVPLSGERKLDFSKIKVSHQSSPPSAHFVSVARDAAALACQAMKMHMTGANTKSLEMSGNWYLKVHAIGEPVNADAVRSIEQDLERLNPEQVSQWGMYYRSLARMIPADMDEHQFLLANAETASRFAARMESSPEP